MKNILLLVGILLFVLLNAPLKAQRMQRALINNRPHQPMVHHYINSAGNCAPDTVLLTTQSSIDSFHINYPGCTDFKSIFIDGSAASPSITNLNGLSVLNKVSIKLRIINTSITTLAGANNLHYIDTLDLQHNLLLTQLGLTNLDSLGMIHFVNLPVFTNMDNFSSHFTKLVEIQIDSTALTSLSGLSNVQDVTNGIFIGNSPVTSIGGMANLTTVGGWINLTEDHSLTSLGLHNLQKCYGYLFWGLPNLQSLEDISFHLINTNISTFWMINTGIHDLSGLDSITGGTNFYLWSNPNLTSLHGLEKLSGVLCCGISIHDNQTLTDISQLHNITGIDESTLEIDNNPLLTNLGGLGNIASIGHGLWITNNQQLTNLDSLNPNLVIHDHINDNNTYDGVIIDNNAQLSPCGFHPLCDYIALGGIIDITNNAAACSDLAAVIASCNIGCSTGDSLTWNGNFSTDWADTTNWTPHRLPTYCTTVTIPPGVPNYPLASNNVIIGGLIMIGGAALDMGSYDLHVSTTLHLEDAVINNVGNIKAERVVQPFVHSSYLQGNFSLLNYTGGSEFWFNTVTGNTILSDSTGRADPSSSFLNTFSGNVDFINNSDYGQNYFSNASSSIYEFVGGNLTVTNNSSADISVGLGGDNALRLAGNFTVNSNNGGVSVTNVTFVGNALNHIKQGGSVPISIENLYVWTGQNVVLDQEVHVSNSLTFLPYEGGIISDTNKLLVLENGCTVSGNSYSGAFVNGPMKKIGNQPFTFPIGTIDASNTVRYGPLTITAPSQPDDAFTAQYFHRNPNVDGYDTSAYTPGFGGINGREYWKLTRDNGTSKVKVTLPYDSARSGPAYAYQYLQIAGWDGSLWRSLGTGGFSGSIFGGSVISGDSLSVYGPLAFSFKPVRRPIITMGNIDSVYCVAHYVPVPFSLDTPMVVGNLFHIEISDTSGNFNTFFNPNIGSKYSSTSDTIQTLNFFMIPGKHYKLRVVGSLLPDTSVNTMTVITKSSPQVSPVIIGPNPACVGTQKYYPATHEPGVTYTWALTGIGTLTTNGDTAIVTWTTTGFVNLVLSTSNLCGTGPVSGLYGLPIRPPAPSQSPLVNNTGRWLYSSLVPVNAGYQWYRNGTLLSGATNSSYYASLSGDYTVRYVNPCGAGPASNTISFGANSIGQTISFPVMPDKTFGDAPFVPAVTASSGLPVSLSIISGPATINSQTNQLTITGTGLVTVMANQVGDNIYDTAAPVTRSFTVNPSSQFITFPSIPDQDLANGTVGLTASASSGLTITYSIVSGPATVSGNTITLNGIGTVIVRATQIGNANYQPAASVDKSFCTTISALNPVSGYTNLCPGSATYTVNSIPGATYFWRIAGGSTLSSTTNVATVNWSSPGTYQLIVSASSNCGAASKNDTLTVNVINSILPDSVHSMLPANGAINQQLPLTLSWVPAHPASFYTFDLYVWRADQSQPSTPYAAGLTTVNYTLPVSSGLLSNQAYKWMVVAHNGSCIQINTGPVQQFTLIPLPDLIVQNVQAPATAFSGQNITINWTVKNNGPGNTTTNQSWTDAVFFSFDSVPDFTIPPNTNPAAWNQLQFPIRTLLLATRPNISALDAGQQYTNSINFTLPVNYSQPLYVYVITNYPAGANAPQQVSFNNDTARAAQPIVVTLSPAPDLRVDTVFTPNTTFSGSTINLTYKVKNYGVLTPSGSGWVDKIYISASPFFDINTAQQLKYPKFNDTYYADAADAAVGNSTQLQADSSYTRSIQVVVPNYIFGTYFIYVFANQTGSLYEGSASANNFNRSQVQVFLTPTPHLTVSALSVPVTTASTTQPIGVNWNVLNTGFNDNIERNKGHYFVQNGTCLIPPPPCVLPDNCTNCVCPPPPPPTPGISFRDSTSFGSSYWIDKVYLSTDPSGLNVNNAILVNQTVQGILNSGLQVPDNYSNPQSTGCKPLGTNGSNFNANTGNVIKPSSNHPKAGNFIIPADLPQGNYYVYVLTNSTKTVFEYPGLPETRRSDLPITIQRPDVVVSSLTAPANATGGIPVTIQYSILNNGPGSVFGQVRRDKIFVSTSPVFDGSAQLINTPVYAENLPVGTPVSHTVNYTFPPSTSGTRYFYVYTNFDSSFRENNSNNNISNALAINVSTATPNDLFVSSVQLADTVYSVFPSLLKYTVTNTGGGTTAGTWRDSVFISCSPTFNPATSYFLAYRDHNEVIPGGSSYSDSFNLSFTYTFNINSCFPQAVYTNAYYFVKTNANNVVYEGSNTTNNITSSGSRVTVNPLVDHIVTQVTGADTATAGRPYQVSWTVKNIGYNPGINYYYNWTDGVYFSPDSVFNSNAVPATAFAEYNILNNNQSYSDQQNAIPPNIPTGDYYVLLRTNNTNGIPGEKVLVNNTNLIRNTNGSAKKVHLLLPVLPDLVDSILSAPAFVATGQPLNVTHKATNAGAGVTYPSVWSDDVWLSADFVPGTYGDILISAKNHSGVLQPGQSYTDSSAATISLNFTPGNYVLISRVNAIGNVFETNLNNNLAFKYVTVYRPAPSDLIVESIIKPDTVYLGYTIDTVKWVIRNNSPNSATGISSDGIYLSAGNVLDSTASLLGIKNKTINMGPLSRDTVQLMPLVNNVTEGNYNLIVKTDLLNNIYESDKTNNTGISVTPVYVAVKELPLNVLTPNTLYNINRYYKLVVPASLDGATILVSLKSGDSLTMKNQLFIGKGYVPSAAQFDYTYNTPNYGNQDIVMTSVTTGVYYITVRNVSLSPVVQNITLKAVKLPFTILSVNSASGGNIGNVTVKISGSLFTNNMTAKLSNSGTTITATTVYFTNSTTVYATFNLQGKPLGLYDVSLTKPDTTQAVLPGGFSIVNANNGGLNNGGGTNTGPGNGNAPGCDPGAAGGINSQLVTELVIPDKVFGGWIFVIQLNYSNPTNTDAPAQTRVLYSQDGLPISLTQQGLGTAGNTLYLQLTGQDGPPGIIRAGGSGTITIYSRAPVTFPAHKHAHFILQ